MRHIKSLAAAAAATALLTVIGTSVAQTSDNANDPMATPPQNVDVTAPNASGQQIYFFRDQGNSPETDPAAHLLLIKHDQPMAPVASTTTTTTTVAQTTTNDNTTTVMPAAADTSNTESTSTAAAAPVDNAEPALAPKADRN